MEYLLKAYHIIMHLDQYLAALVSQYGPWIYALLFLIIFCETGLVVTPLLPGDSLLFAAGSISAIGGLNIHLLAILLFTAAVLGDTVNYALGHWLGPKLFTNKKSRFLNPAYLQRAHAFYEHHGGKAVILARFIPIVRTFIPFVAGMAKMHYPKFLCFNIIGAFIWVYGLLYISYFFGNIPVIKQNFSLMVIIIIILSILPAIYEFYRQRRQLNK